MAALLRVKDPLWNSINNSFCELIPNFPKTLSDIINEYVIQQPDCFGGEEWRKYFGVNIGNPSLPNEFFSWLGSHDAVDILENSPRPRYNYETHIVVYRPQFINGKTYTLSTLLNLSKNKVKWEPAITMAQMYLLKQIAKIPAGSQGWLALRKGAVAQDPLYSKQIKYINDLNKITNAHYECETALLDVATVIASWYLLKKKERCIEGCYYARCKDVVPLGVNDKEYQVIIGDFSHHSRLDINCDLEKNQRPAYGVLLLRKFEEG